MIEYIKNIIPRIKNFSERIDKEELLLDKTWVWVNFSEGISTFHFLSDKRLLISNLGDVREGSWEFIGKDLLHLKGDGFNVLLNQGIIFKGVLIIQKKGLMFDYEIMYDEALIPDGDVIKYINDQLPPAPPEPILSKPEYPLSIKIDGREILFFVKPDIGIIVGSEVPFSGKIKGLPNFHGVEIHENKIIRVYYCANIETDSGTIELEINNRDWENPKGTGYFLDQSSIPDGEFQIKHSEPFKTWKRIYFKHGDIEYVGYLDKEILRIILMIILAIASALLLGVIFN